MTSSFSPRGIQQRFLHRTLCGLVCAAQLMVCACDRASPGTPAPSALDRVIKNGKLRCGYFVQPPAVMKDPNTGKVFGTFVDAIETICRDLNVRPDYIEVDIAKFSAGLQNDLFDVSIGPTFRTIKRAAAVEFTDTIFYLGYTGVAKPERAEEFAAEAQIDREGVTVAVKEGSAIHNYAVDHFSKARLLVLSGTDLSLPLQAVSSGQADVGLMNEHTVEYYLREHKDVELLLGDKPIQVIGMSWAIRPGDQRWLNFLNTSLEALISTGQFSTFERVHYGKPLRRTLMESCQ